MIDKRIRRLQRIETLLHHTANSFAGNKTGTAAVKLHEASTAIHDARRMIERGVTAQDEVNMLTNWFTTHPTMLKILTGK